jgi:ATP-dependent protease ClpP protease subunit
MDKIPFKITASTQGQKALIRITGTIGWDIDCEEYRRQIDEISGTGITDAHLYLNGPGGSCFDAEEIVNITGNAFSGTITGEGGALVASAYTRIAMMCETFIMPANGMFMIHKPSGCVAGAANDIRAYLKLISDIETRYLDKYKEKSADAALLEKQWNAGDWWMTAKEARENGFISSVKEKTKIDACTAALITACGCPASKVPIINNKTNESMDLRAMAISLGLPGDATEDAVNAAIAKAKKAQEDLAALQTANEKRDKEEKVRKIKERLDKAQLVDKVINGETRPAWEQMLNNDFETGCKALDGLAPVKKLTVITGGSAVNTTYKGKTFEELQNEDPGLLAELEKNEPEVFEELFNASLKKR